MRRDARTAKRNESGGRAKELPVHSESVVRLREGGLPTRSPEQEREAERREVRRSVPLSIPEISGSMKTSFLPWARAIWCAEQWASRFMTDLEGHKCLVPMLKYTHDAPQDQYAPRNDLFPSHCTVPGRTTRKPSCCQKCRSSCSSSSALCFGCWISRKLVPQWVSSLFHVSLQAYPLHHVGDHTTFFYSNHSV